MSNKQIGTLGEDYAVEHLKSSNYKILARNFSCKYGEIDIIAKYKHTIVFVEVKTRRSENFGKGMEAVNYHKQQKIRKVALFFLKQNYTTFSGLRFDVIDIMMKSDDCVQVEHVVNAF
ncbi:MAG: YraN family protein [Tepidanaerobacteraceae bacterium]|jgi:putative endonuclease|nr:YraN family protein [Thermoanaerobacterales bacterium]